MRDQRGADLAQIAIRVAEHFRQSIDEIGGRIVSNEVPHELCGDMACGGWMARKIEERTKEKYAGLMSGMNLPPGMKLPF